MRLPAAACVLLILTLAQSALALEGRVVYEDGKPAASAVVYALSGARPLTVHNNTVMMGERFPRALTDADGHFSFGETEAADAIFVRDLEERCALVSPVPSDAPASITLPRAAKLEIDLFKGVAPVPGERIYATLQGSRSVSYRYEGKTDGAGHIKFTGAMPGTYLIQTIQEVPQVGCCFRSVVTKQANVTVKPGASPTVRLGGTGLPTVTGVVKSSEGEPLHGVWVRLKPKQEPAPETQDVVWSDVTTSEGRYALHDVPPGDYELIGFRRLAENNYSRTLQTVQELAVTQEPEQSCDVAVDLSAFMPLDYDTPAPELEGRLLDGSAFKLSENRGGIVVIHFYAGWCIPCVEGMADLDKIAQEFADSGVVVLGVSLDESEEEFRAFVAEKKVAHPVLFDGPWASSEPRKAFRVVDVPSSFVIDAKGNVVQRDLFGDVLRDYLRRLQTPAKP